MCQGNLLALDPNTIYLYSNTLQAIATGYLITALLFLFTSRRTQIITAVVLLLVYWTAMQFITVDGYGGGNYTPQGNLAEWIDNTVLGRFRDTAQVIDGKVVVADWYHYTWILSSLNFGVTVLTGLFAGYIAKDKIEEKKKLKLYFGTGITMVIAGWLWNFQMPVIKTIWTSSMVLVSSGYCFLLMGLFYYWIDYKGHRSGITWLKVYGMNSIVAYMLANVVNFRCIGESLFYGLEQYMGSYYSFLMTLWNIGAVYVIIWFMYNGNFSEGLKETYLSAFLMKSDHQTFSLGEQMFFPKKMKNRFVPYSVCAISSFTILSISFRHFFLSSLS